MPKRIRDYGFSIGELPTGALNKITDVPDVLVGHATIDTPDNKTGVTVLLPSRQNPFTHKLPAACFVLNGFGKTQGLVQIEELGTLETPIALTNTLNIGLVHDALVSYMIARCQAEQVELWSVNPIVCECNDADLNQIHRRVVGEDEVFAAIASACADFQEGDVGGGKGTVCHSLKGGIGSSSRLIDVDGKTYTLGVLVQTNHGRFSDLMIGGKKLAPITKDSAPDQGSVITIVATDLPLSDRQLKRVIKRTSVGLARLGSFIGHGSGEIMIGFSTADPILHHETRGIVPRQILNESLIDLAFRAAAQATEEAVLNSMVTAAPTRDRCGEIIHSLQEYL